jgi:chromate reductase
MTTQPIHLVGFAGSLRKDSHSRSVLRTVAGLDEGRSRFSVLDPGTLPLYNADIDGPGAPEAATAFRQAIAEADGVVIVTPEYNYGISGVLKNALDWASRPAYHSPLKGKPVLMMSVSPAFTGGVRALAQLRLTLAATLSCPLPIPEIVIAGAADKIKDGMLVDESAIGFIRDSLDLLVEDIASRRQTYRYLASSST